MSTTQVIVLAAGHGKRMGQRDIPKVLIPLNGKALIGHVVTAIKASGICDRPTIVVGQHADQVKEALGDQYEYVTQANQLGTGHAVACTQPALKGKADQIIVLYGDQPYVSAGTIKRLAETHQQSGAVLTMATVMINDFDDWRKPFYDFGRIIRDEQDRVCAIVEKKDASPEELAIKNVNPSFFCFTADWLWANLNRLTSNNAQREYYLTDLAKIACDEGSHIATIEIEPREALGINTQEQLELLKTLDQPQ